MRKSFLLAFAALATSYMVAGRSPSFAQETPVDTVVLDIGGRPFKNYRDFQKWTNKQVANPKSKLVTAACENETGMVNVKLRGIIRKVRRRQVRWRQISCPLPPR